MAATSTEKNVTELARLQESEARAWHNYSKSLEGLAGEAYNEAEDRSWSRLQRRLGEIESRRAELSGGRTSKTS